MLLQLYNYLLELLDYEFSEVISFQDLVKSEDREA